MKKLLLLGALALTTAVSAQTEGIWEEYLVIGNKLQYFQNIEVVEVRGSFLLLTPKMTYTFRKRLDGTVLTNQNDKGEYYFFINDKLHVADNDGQLDPDYVKLNKIK